MIIINLPTDIIGEILLYVNKNWLHLTNKKNWLNYYNGKKEMPLNIQRSYYRFLLRNNMYFVFDIYYTKLLNKYEIIDKRKYNKKFKYKNLTFSNLVDEIKYFCQDYRIKNKCHSIIVSKKNKKIKQKSKYKFKKTKKKNIEWTN